MTGFCSTWWFCNSSVCICVAQLITWLLALLCIILCMTKGWVWPLSLGKWSGGFCLKMEMFGAFCTVFYLICMDWSYKQEAQTRQIQDCCVFNLLRPGPSSSPVSCLISLYSNIPICCAGEWVWRRGTDKEEEGKDCIRQWWRRGKWQLEAQCWLLIDRVPFVSTCIITQTLREGLGLHTVRLYWHCWTVQ